MKMTAMHNFTSKVAGIPCIIEVTYLHVQEPLGPNCDSDWDCYGYTDIEYDVYDRRGRPAPWLEKKLTQADDKRIKEEAVENAGAYDADFD